MLVFVLELRANMTSPTPLQRNLNLKRQVCLCLASADQAVVAALFSRLAPGTASASASANAASVSNPLGSPPSPRAGGGGGGVGVPSSIGDAILERAREMGCSTTNGVLELLRWCTPRVLCLDGASPTVTDALLLKRVPLLPVGC